MAGGWICLIFAWIGVVTPGIPFSHFVLGAAFCFAKSSPRMHNYIMNHKVFGPFITNWSEKRIFPTRAKYFMVVMMSISLAILWFTTHNLTAALWSGIFMVLVAVWAWRYPGSSEEWEKRNKINNLS